MDITTYEESIARRERVLERALKTYENVVEKNNTLSIQTTYWSPELSFKSEENTMDQSDSQTSTSELIPMVKQPKETLKKSLSKLKSSYWNECLMGLQDIVQVSKMEPQLLVDSMAIVYKGIVTLIQSLRPTAEKAACQAAKQLFVNGPNVQGPEFEELIHVLLQKTTNASPHIRKNIVEALDSMVFNVSPVYYMKILLHRKTSACNVTVRTIVAKLLVNALDVLGSNPDITLNDDIKSRLVQTTVRFLQDSCYEIRYNGVRLVTMIMHNKQYESVLLSKVSIPMLKRINKIIENTKKEQCKA